MRKSKKKYWPLLTYLAIIVTQTWAYAQTDFRLDTKFDNDIPKFTKVDRGIVKIEEGKLKTKEAYATFGEDDWTDYEVSFKARTSATEKEVQIWTGFRASSRNDRYILGIRGGIQNDLYLARLGYMGTDDHLALRHLEFPLHPGEWYNVKIQVFGNRIRVFLNNEALPRIDIEDMYSRFSPTGKIVLGGSWLINEFDDLKVRSLSVRDFDITLPFTEFSRKPINKEEKRQRERAAYKSINISSIVDKRISILLNGKWLFLPGYEVSNEADIINGKADDAQWHVMHVPDFWNPNREWLHGEKYNTASKGISDNFYQKEIERCEAYTFDYEKTEVGYYRHWINLPTHARNKKFVIKFDAVSKVAEVYVNGTKVAHHIGMFGEFKADATKVIKPGRNMIVVKVTRDYVKDIENPGEIKDVSVTVPITNKMLKDLAHGFYNDDPAGIWQPVSLEITDLLKVEDVFIKPNLQGSEFEVTIKNQSKKDDVFSLGMRITDKLTKEQIYNKEPIQHIRLKAGQEKKLVYEVNGLSPKLWSPSNPNLYDFAFVIKQKEKIVDEKIVTSAFRTFEAKGDYLYLNGHKYWLRGGNHTPMSLAPNDTLLADTFSKLMRQANIAITRTHTAPYSETWMQASDKNGIGLSYEGQWPWLMIHESFPDQHLIDLWKEEFFDLMKKYRNHPSLLFWTVNNEMKFYDNDPDFERVKIKMKIISDVVKKMREIDPTRPIVFDSNYRRNEKKFGKDYFNEIDDGDIDDQHWYINWYHGSVFSEFKGEWQKRFKNPNRPLISQEFSTGYPSETGHPTRFYTYVHQNPASLVGNYAYEYADPKYFLQAQSFISRESAEAIRRSNDNAAGILHFATLTWFKNVYLHDKIVPHVTYDLMRKALQPVLVSAEIWGRHFYAGEKLPARVYVVNDSEDNRDLKPTTLTWSIVVDGKPLTSGEEQYRAIPYYGRAYLDLKMNTPTNLPADRVDAKLVLRLSEEDHIISENEYEITIANKKWLNADAVDKKKITVLDREGGLSEVLDYQGVSYTKATTLDGAIQHRSDLLVVSDLENVDIDKLKHYIANGGKAIILNPEENATMLYPNLIRGLIKEDAEIISMEIPESSVFDGIEPMDLRYFNDNSRENPLVAKSVYQINRGSNIEPLAVFTKVHGYLEGPIEQRIKTLDAMRGFPLVKIKDKKGEVILSEILFHKAKTDPVAGKLLVNLIFNLTYQ
ncbi:glycoside hydrolase family 2 protein [Sphingobacterium haloxyli]|uniref:beta-galactosidase n=1 Tax=Sphingobacterium haloxyli TaxID=2100533 RepID=A0A2S9J817_9SPHI|nr:glycoside hydrolase family 2 TIM barrel-domain containing protein [Sphingobacterium haloxyli]PRD48879.1 glycoside hydrolase family 2 [Sphingobacterium haloxyli]